MDILNDTPFQFAPFPGRLLFPKHSLTLIVKGTFDLKPGGPIQEAGEQVFPTGDEYFPDDEDQHGSVRYASDFTYYKPMADLLLAGKCHPPNGGPAQACRVTFQVGDRSRSLAVFGDRQWKGFLKSMSDPEPFTQMEIRYEKGYGGEGYLKNPIGKGYEGPGKKKAKSPLELPNIEDVDNLLRSPKNQPEPLGFGPLGSMWDERASKMGNYKKNYLKERWPWFPKDMDLRFFNAAPKGLRVEGYLKGNEALYFENLHPTQPHYRSQLPNMMVRCFLNLNPAPDSQTAKGKPVSIGRTDPGKMNFEEIPMNLDTLWVDMEAEKVVLIWRGWTNVQSEEFEEVRDVYIMSEPADQAAGSLAECHKRFLKAVAAEEEKWGLAPEAPPEEPEKPGPDSPIETPVPKVEGNGVPDINPEQFKADVNRQVSALLAQAGIDLEALSPEARGKMQAEQDEVIDQLTEADPAKVLKQQQAKLEAQLSESLAAQGIDINKLPPPSEKALAEQARFMKELGMDPADMDTAQDPQMGQFWAITAALMPKMGLDPENLDPMIEGAKKQLAQFNEQAGAVEEEEKPDGGDQATETPAGENAGDSPGPWTRARVEEASQKGDSFSGEDLSGLDLSNLDLKEGDFSEAILMGANLKDVNFSGANLTQANLASSDLSHANLERASLKEADLTQSTLAEARITGAILNDAIFQKARMSQAVLEQVEAIGTTFSEADLSGAKFMKSNLSGADFSRANLDDIDFSEANLSEASVEGARGKKTRFDKANLSNLRASGACDFSSGSFRGVTAPGSMWADAKLTEANFSFSRMEGATFTKANLEKSILNACDMKFCRFRKANLKGAFLIKTNLFEGSLEKADLSGADLRGSNLYGVEFLDAVTQGAEFDLANLKSTKLFDPKAV